ncbi:MAG: acyltransferase, partial [Bacteroidaceae bacterium]|nr:acyltransferase [Bacteroidaceae bacterium]
MNLFLLSKHRSSLMGIAIFLVVLFHAPHIFPDTFFDLIQSQGNLGVDIFFLISGIGLFFSWTKNPDAGLF